MTAGLAAMLLGVFAVPAALLWAGHRLRRRSSRWRRAFWFALVAHVVALAAGSVAAMALPQMWVSGDAGRGFFGFWSFLTLPVAAALLGAATVRRTRDDQRAGGHG